MNSDSSGDSDDDTKPSKKYKDHLTRIDELIRNQMRNDIRDDEARTLDLFQNDFSYPTESINHSDVNIWNYLNSTEGQPNDPLNSRELVIPLFHAVPFMRNQFTNNERRIVFERISQLNERLINKIINKKDDKTLENDRANLFNIYSRTTTVSCGILSLFEIDNLDKYNKLENSNKICLNSLGIILTMKTHL